MGCIGSRSSGQNVFPPASYEQKLRIKAVRSHGPVQVDGRLLEPAWQQCPVATNFMITDPDQGKKASYETTVRVMYDSTNLYISAVCEYPPGRRNLQVQDMRRDFSFSNNELFNVVLEPFQDARMPVVSFFTSPYGTQTDVVHYDDRAYDYNWDAVWRAKSTIEDSAWITELCIPFSSLRYPADSVNWSINFSRHIRNMGEITGWSPWPLAYTYSRIAYAGLLTDVHPPRPRLNLRIQPYTLLRVDKHDNRTQIKVQPGGELKWAINTNTVMDATFNTDFAQADVDKQVINLDRSSVFFPEKRQFFKENANLFSVGQDEVIQPFFTRRIGLSDNGTILPIHAGLRLLHQSARQSAGMLLMRQGGDSLNAPAWFNVLRYKRNIGNSLQLGAMTVLRYNDATPTAPSSFNPVAAIDGFWRIGQKVYLRNMLSCSSGGMAAVTEVSYSDNQLNAGVTGALVNAGYQAQSGFTAREDFMYLQPSAQLFLQKKWLPRYITFFNPKVSADIYYKASTKAFQEGTLVFAPISFIFRNRGEYKLNITAARQQLDAAFTPVPDVSIPPGRYSYIRYELFALTNQGAPYGVEARLSTGGYYHGRLNSYFVALRVAPVPYVAFVLNFTRNDFSGAPVVKHNNKATTTLLAPEVRLAANANLQLSAFYQYNTAINTSALNMRFSWQYRPLSFIYFVYNSARSIDEKGLAQPLNQQSGIVKVSYLKQF